MSLDTTTAKPRVTREYGHVLGSEVRLPCCTFLMPMICADCKRDLDEVPVRDPCPQCGGNRRSAVVSGEAALVAVSAMAETVKIGYSVARWTHQWRTIQRHLGRLREQYQGIGMLGNIDVEDTVDALFLALNHLYDWLLQDSATTFLGKSMLDSHVSNHGNSLGLRRDYANTRKHMKRNSASAQLAQITNIETGPNGHTATIGYWPGNQPNSVAETDALALAEQCEQDWRSLLATNGIPVPQ